MKLRSEHTIAGAGPTWWSHARLLLVALFLLLMALACSHDQPALEVTVSPTATPSSIPLHPTATAAPRLDFEAISSAEATTGMVVGTSAPDAVRAGVAILEQGGSAADAALATALAQVPLMPGNFISYAGIMEFLYYNAHDGKVYSLNAGWNVPLGETHAATIPATGYPYRGESNPSGRTALVPGFMAGLASAHERFGRLPFDALFEPAIAYARQGLMLDGLQGSFIAEFEPVITRLPETAALFTREDGKLYQTGDLYRQPHLSEVLTQVAKQGATYMYTGDWGQAFVDTVRREGGKISMEDMAAYEALWVEPVHTTYRDLDVFGAGLPSTGGVTLIEAINLLEAADLGQYDHFSRDPEAMFWMMQIGRASVLSALTTEQLAAVFLGQDLSPETRLTKESASWLWKQMQAGNLPLFTAQQKPPNTHSAAVVAVDADGNIAALTHTSNSYLYGGSGISVNGVYIPDPGSYLQATLAATGPGRRVPSPINPVIVLRDGLPVWASSAIGQVNYETLQRLASVLVFDQDLLRAQTASPLLAPRLSGLDGTVIEQVFAGTFDAAQLEAVRAMGQPVVEIPLDFESYVMNRGVLAGISLNPIDGSLTGAVPTALGGYAGGY